MGRRKTLPVATRTLVLHECGYKCSNPTCRMVLTLDIHHIEYVSNGGNDTPENLVALCPNCHALHHKGHIPQVSLRAWKFLLLALNEAFDQKSVDILLALDRLNGLMIWGDGLIACASLVASDLIRVHEQTEMVETTSGSSIFFSSVTTKENRVSRYWIELSTKGHTFLDGWKRGDQNIAISTQIRSRKS